MTVIPITQVGQEYQTIELQNGKIAKLHQVILTRVPEINKEEDILVYKYKVPCPLCNTDTMAFSYDGKFFSNIQLNCRHCGIFFRPVIKR